MAKLQSLGHNDALLPLHRYSSFLLAHQSLAFKYEQALPVAQEGTHVNISI